MIPSTPSLRRGEVDRALMFTIVGWSPSNHCLTVAGQRVRVFEFFVVFFIVDFQCFNSLHVIKPDVDCPRGAVGASTVIRRSSTDSDDSGFGLPDVAVDSVFVGHVIAMEGDSSLYHALDLLSTRDMGIFLNGLGKRTYSLG